MKGDVQKLNQEEVQKGGSTQPQSTIDDWIEKNLNSTEWDLNSYLMWRVRAQLKEDFVKQRAEVFRDNLAAADELVQLPFYIAALPHFQEAQTEVTGIVDELLQAFPAVRSEFGELLQLFQKIPDEGIEVITTMKKSGQFSAFCEKIGELLALFLRYGGKNGNDLLKKGIRPALESKEESMSAIENLLRTSTCSMWTSLEVLASDLWVDSVNFDPMNLALPAIKEKGGQEIKGLTQKEIKVGLLSKHRFNLTNVMGDLLRPKFDFTSVSGIEKAFRTLFGTAWIGWDEELVKQLFLIEQIRHVIQHRAGIADQKFIATTSGAYRVGERVCITAKDYHKFKGVIVRGAVHLIAATDRFFAGSGNRVQVQNAE